MGNVVIVTHWLDGDVIPFIRIGKELKKRKHDVTLITHCHFEDAARKAGIDFVRVHNVDANAKALKMTEVILRG